VVDADATVIFTMGRLTRGSLRTAEFARAHRRPYLHVDLGHMTAARAVREVVGWLRNEAGIDYDDYLAVVPADCTLNVAGSRESKAAGIADELNNVMHGVIAELAG
jgi:hypothetical protein